jgi:hypothetical protein
MVSAYQHLLLKAQLPRFLLNIVLPVLKMSGSIFSAVAYEISLHYRLQ